MVFNTVSVGTAVTPTVIETYFSHFLNRKSLHQKPTAHISYHEGINLIRQFLKYASHHTVEDIQGFTSQWVPSPRWIKVDEVDIPLKAIADAAKLICAQLGHKGVDQIGGRTWWQWRREGSKLQSEWIEMRRDYSKRKASGAPARRVMLYVHGGAYFFGSVDAHRYQLQRHARKLEAKLFARNILKSLARYRLSPQFPFPCGLLDCLASYLQLLTLQNPSEVVLAGDSAGAGMVLSLLVILRDQGIALPAGAILISPWVDLTHSFPSVVGEGSLDYIPGHGFMQRPSPSWPPPSSDDIKEIAMHAVEQVAEDAMPRKSTQVERKHAAEDAIQGFSVKSIIQEHSADPQTETAQAKSANRVPGPGRDLSIVIDGKLVEIKDQIQMYTTNQLISHPLVSPVLQPSLGGLPPLLILTGGGEVLRDEQIYLAHKAANPAKYPPGESYLEQFPEERDMILKYKPTDVQLQVWDDLCHVAPTLSFTRPAKYMFRSVAQFGAWALARAQKRDIEIQDDDEMSVISSESEDSEKEDTNGPKHNDASNGERITRDGKGSRYQVGKAGQPLPRFKNHMIRQRVDRHGNTFPLDPSSSLPALQLHPNEIGVIKPGPVSQWMKAKQQWDSKYAREKRKVQKDRTKEMAAGYQGFGNDEVPPPSALAGRRSLNMAKEEKKSRSWGMSIWSLWGSSHDQQTMEREEKAGKEVETSTATEIQGLSTNHPQRKASRSKSRRQTITDLGQSEHQIDGDVDKNTLTAILGSRRKLAESSKSHDGGQNVQLPEKPNVTGLQEDAKDEDEKVFIAANPKNRPVAGSDKAFPFKLNTHLAEDGVNASTVTLQSHVGVVADKESDQAKLP